MNGQAATGTRAKPGWSIATHVRTTPRPGHPSRWCGGSWRLRRLGPGQIDGRLGMPASTVHAVLVRCRIDRATGEPLRTPSPWFVDPCRRHQTSLDITAKPRAAFGKVPDHRPSPTTAATVQMRPILGSRPLTEARTDRAQILLREIAERRLGVPRIDPHAPPDQRLLVVAPVRRRGLRGEGGLAAPCPARAFVSRPPSITSVSACAIVSYSRLGFDSCRSRAASLRDLPCYPADFPDMVAAESVLFPDSAMRIRLDAARSQDLFDLGGCAGIDRVAARRGPVGRRGAGYRLPTV